MNIINWLFPWRNWVIPMGSRWMDRNGVYWVLKNCEGQTCILVRLPDHAVLETSKRDLWRNFARAK